jgi:hypothetical protein
VFVAIIRLNKMQVISLLSEELLAFQDGLCSKKFVGVMYKE